MPELSPPSPGVSTLPEGGGATHAGGAVSPPEVSTGPATGAPAPRLRRRWGPVFWLSAGWLVVLVFLAAAADLLPLPSYTATNLGPPGAVPSLHHLLGTDDLGRDMLSRV